MKCVFFVDVDVDVDVDVGGLGLTGGMKRAKSKEQRAKSKVKVTAAFWNRLPWSYVSWLLLLLCSLCFASVFNVDSCTFQTAKEPLSAIQYTPKLVAFGGWLVGLYLYSSGAGA